MALQHAAPSLDVLLMAYHMAQQRGQQLDIEAYMTDEMKREWFSRQNPYLPVEFRQHLGAMRQASEVGREEQGGKRRRFEDETVMHADSRDESEASAPRAGPEEGAGEDTMSSIAKQDDMASGPEPPSTADSISRPPDAEESARTPSRSTRRSKPSLLERQWEQRRRSRIPDPGNEDHTDSNGRIAEIGLDGVFPKVEEGVEPLQGTIAPPAQANTHTSNVGIGSGNWRRKPEAEIDKAGIQASASYW